MILYNLILFIYHNAIRLASLWHPKANAWVGGRKEWQTTLANQMTNLSHPIWIHCASLGEFEQGRPLIEKIKQERPEIAIVLSFYSPSGFELRKDYLHADVITYLPADTPANARLFLELVQPQMAIFVKYEFWLNYLNELVQQQIPHYLIAGSFRKEQIFFKWYGGKFRSALQGFTKLFVQTEQDKILLNLLIVENVVVAGDPRIDRVSRIAQSPQAIPLVAEMTTRGPLLIMGSSWPPEEKILIDYLRKNLDTPYRFVIAPHDISESHISELTEQLPLPFQLFSHTQEYGLSPDTKILIIDNIGLLSSIYQYGKIAFIGGGFGAGIHNILEPVVFGLPVIMGPNYHKFPEAKMLVARGGAFEIAGLTDFEKRMYDLSHRLRHEEAKVQNLGFIEENRGATAQIFYELADRWPSA